MRDELGRYSDPVVDCERVRVTGWHEHPRDPRYLMAPSPLEDVTWTHAHGERTKADHVDSSRREKEHGVQDVTTDHEHRDRRRVGTPLEQRIDVHPRTLRLLDEDPDLPLFWSIEGSIKADAILSKGYPAIAVPSVTMWPARELERFAERYMRGRRIYVVPDADWETNSQVALQAFVCVDALMGLRVKAAVAASPGPDKGVDDYLAHGGKVEDLVVIRREITPEFDAWADLARADSDDWIFSPDRESIVRVTWWLALHADDEGHVMRPGRTMAKYTRLSLGKLDSVTELVTDRRGYLENELGIPAPFTAEDILPRTTGHFDQATLWGRRRYQSADHVRGWGPETVWFWTEFTVRGKDPNLRARRIETTVGADFTSAQSPHMEEETVATTGAQRQAR
jgi:hypothetical protein